MAMTRSIPFESLCGSTEVVINAMLQYWSFYLPSLSLSALHTLTETMTQIHSHIDMFSICEWLLMQQPWETCKLYFLTASCNCIRQLGRHKQCNQIPWLFIEPLFDHKYTWKRNKTVFIRVCDTAALEGNEHFCIRVLLCKIWQCCIYSHQVQVRYIFHILKEIPGNVSSRHLGAALQLSRLLKDNKWLQCKTAIEILSVCGIKNNWTNRDKRVSRIQNGISFYRPK